MPSGAPGNPGASSSGSSGSSGGGGGYGGHTTGPVGHSGLGTANPSPTTGGLAGSQGHAQPKAAVQMDMANMDISPESRAQAMDDPISYFSKTDIFGDTRSDQVNYAKQNNLRNVTFHGDFGSTFGHVTGLAPHQSDNTPFADRTIPGDPEGLGRTLAGFAAGAIGPIGTGIATVSSMVDAGEGLTNTSLFSGLNAVLGSKSPFSRSTTTPTRSTTTPTTSPTTSPESSTTPVSVPKPKVKPNINLPQGYQGHGPGPNVPVLKTKKGGRIKRKKNYSKGGGVRSANY